MATDVTSDNDVAADIARGVSRLLFDMGYSPLTELTLNTGRRVDVIGLDASGHIVFVEIKSGVPDFRADDKWTEYLDYCDQFYFAVMRDFPVDILPGDVGLIIADRFGGQVIRPAPDQPAHGSRRRAVLLRYARTAAGRLLRADEIGA